MARNQNNQSSNNLDQFVRSIVREEIRNMFSGNAEEDQTGQPEFASENGTSAVTSTRRATAGRKGGKAKTAGKGRVTNPNDKRLKQNREAEA